MKILSQTSREYKGTKYQKYWIIIPNTLLQKLGWKTGTELKSEVKGHKLVIEKD